MAAAKTVYQIERSRNYTSLTPEHGVLTLFGYGITVRVDRGHLIVEDRSGPVRRIGRFPRVAHGLRRLVVIGSDGIVSLAALRWLADQDASFVMLDRDGSVLATTGPVLSSDARLRRAQALAHQSDAAVQIARELISRKLAGQEQVAGSKLLDAKTGEAIAKFRTAVSKAQTLDAIRYLESQAAVAYWAAWRDLPITYPKKDLPRVPGHWRIFGTRKSPLSGSPRLAANPANAMLNYLYAVLESEARLAAATIGLDPGLGFLHVDTPARDSLACDLMEAVRPQVDGYLLDWITRTPLKREWFFELAFFGCENVMTSPFRPHD
jgi:CRISPR-associated endonuclease Cas1